MTGLLLVTRCRNCDVSSNTSTQTRKGKDSVSRPPLGSAPAITGLLLPKKRIASCFQNCCTSSTTSTRPGRGKDSAIPRQDRQPRHARRCSDILSGQTWICDTTPFRNSALEGMVTPDFSLALPALATASARVKTALGLCSRFRDV